MNEAEYISDADDPIDLAAGMYSDLDSVIMSEG